MANYRDRRRLYCLPGCCTSDVNYSDSRMNFSPRRNFPRLSCLSLSDLNRGIGF